MSLSSGDSSASSNGGISAVVGSGIGVGGALSLTAGVSSLVTGGAVSISGGAGSAATGGAVVIQGGVGASSVEGGGVEINAADGSTRLKVTDDDISLTSGTSGSIYMTVSTGTSDESFDTSSDEIAFGFNSESSSVDYDGDGVADPAYDIRLQHFATGNQLISNVPFLLTVVDYSSDVRIKRKIVPADTDELLQRIQQVEYKRYRYTEAWRDVRGIDDVEVRGVIAQQLHEVFPEHVTVLDEYKLPEKGFQFDGFHQVNKQGLTMDMLGAMQAMHRRFKTGTNSASKTGEITFHRQMGTKSICKRSWKFLWRRNYGFW